MPPRRVGVVGLGAISKYYLAAIDRLPDWTLAAVCDARASTLDPHRASGVPGYDDHRRMLAETDLDAVVVAVPNHAHAEICRDALDARLPVCVEKPLAIRGAEGRELVERARVLATPLFTAFHRRYNDQVLSLRRTLETAVAKAAGARIASLRVRYLERIEEHIGADTWYLDPRRCGGGCVADNGPNAFDLVRQFLGDVEVTGSVISRDSRGTDRQAVVDLSARCGGTARVELDWSHAGETKDIEVRLDDGRTLYADMLANHTGFKASLWHEYAGILDDFASTFPPRASGVSGTSRARADGSDGLTALELVEASYRGERTATTARERG